MTVTVLRLGIDTLEASVGGTAYPHALEVLEQWKLRAQELDAPQYAPLSGIDLALQPQGAKPYRYVLAGDEFSLRLSGARSIPPGFVRLSALGLALYEPAVLYGLASGVLAEWFGPEGPHKLSRIDVACDFQGLDLSDLHGARFVSPARYRPIFPSVDAPETYQFGRGELVVRVYNKTRELAVSGKEWMNGLWAQNPAFDPALDVWRFEVQLRRAVLRKLGIETPDAGIEAARDLLRFGLGYADLRVPQGASSDRWPRHPAWQALECATGSHSTLTREALTPGLGSLSRIVPAVTGYAISAGAALGIAEFPRVWAILEPHVRARLDDLGGFEGAVRARRTERLGKGDRR